MTSMRKRPAEGSFSSGTVIFNIGGQHFEVLRRTIDAHPKALLASLVQDVSSFASPDEPVFVDANAERFAHILDWYRYGEMFLPPGPMVAAVLRDARFFLLPEKVTVNGVVHTLSSGGAQGPFESVMKGVIERWEGFDEYVERMVTQANRAWTSLMQVSRTAQDDYFDGNVDFGTLRPHSVRLADSEDAGSRKWKDPKNVCNVYRLQLLVYELNRRGFACDVQADQYEVMLHMSARRPGGSSGVVQAVQVEGVKVECGRLAVNMLAQRRRTAESPAC